MNAWYFAMIGILPLMWGGTKPRAWCAIMASSLLSLAVPFSPLGYLVTDLICGALVLARPAQLPQRAIGLLFTVMALLDLGYLLSPQLDGGLLFYRILFGLGWVQLAILAAWGAYDTGKTAGRRIGAYRHQMAPGPGNRK